MRFFNIIDKKTNLLSRLDPDRFYVENIRSIFNLPHPLAKFYCEMAVKQSYFIKKFGIICLNEECKRLIISFDSKSDLPKSIKCEQCELLERDKYVFELSEKDIIEFYQIRKSL
jgi:hypothetical protein